MAKPDAILASNTSSLKLADIATALKDPTRLVGIHFFNPVPQLQLVEVVSSAHRPSRSSRRTRLPSCAQIDKLPLPVKDSPGFLVNRVLGPYMQNAFPPARRRRTSPRRWTRPWSSSACRWARPSSPTPSGWTSASPRARRSPRRPRCPKVLANKVALGHLGKKTGQGIYRYENGKAVKGQPDAFDDALVQSADRALPARGRGGAARRHRRRRRPGRRRAHLRHRIRAVPRRDLCSTWLQRNRWSLCRKTSSPRCA